MPKKKALQLKKKIVLTLKKRAIQRPARKKIKTSAATKGRAAVKPIGKVTHFFGHIQVMIAKFSTPVSLGVSIRVTGATTDFATVITSMQFDHKPIKTAKKRQEVGIKVSKRVREGDLIYKV